MMADDQGRTIFEHRLAVITTTCRVIIKNSMKYLSLIENSENKGSLIMIDRYLNLCEHQKKAIEMWLSSTLYGPLNNDERLLKMQSDLIVVLDKLTRVKQVLIDKGYENNFKKYLMQQQNCAEKE